MIGAKVQKMWKLKKNKMTVKMKKKNHLELDIKQVLDKPKMKESLLKMKKNKNKNLKKSLNIKRMISLIL